MKPVQRPFVLQWLILLSALLVLGSYGTWTLYVRHEEIGEHERERLAGQARIVEEILRQYFHLHQNHDTEQ